MKLSSQLQKVEMKSLNSDKLRLDVTRNRIIANGNEIELPSKAIQVLYLLMIKSKQTVSREELIELVWNGNELIGEKALTHTVWQIRKALNEPDTATFIETIPKIGYRFLETARVDSDEELRTNKNLILRFIVTSVFLLVVSIVIFWLKKSDNLSQNTLQLDVDMVTSYSGVESSPDISSDGNQLVFQWVKNDKSSDIYRLDLDRRNATPIPVTQTPYEEYSPVWSPDNNRVAFVRKVGPTGCSVIIRTIMTQEERLIDECAGGYFYSIAWSPDGKYLAYPYHNYENHTGGIVAYNLETRVKTVLSEKLGSPFFVDSNPCWSPDSKRLAYTRLNNPAKFDLNVVNLDKNSSLQFDAVGTISGCAFDVSGDNIIYAKEDFMESINLNSGKRSPLSLRNHTGGKFRSPRISEVANKLFFTSFKQEVNLSKINNKKAQGSSFVFFIRSIGTDYQGQYSPDGSQVVFESTRDGEHGIWISDSDGSKQRKLNTIPSEYSYPTWSPKGDKLALIGRTNHSNITQVFEYDFISDKLSQVSNNIENHAPPTWSRDGSSILSARLKDGVWNIWKYHLDRIKHEQVTTLGGLYAQQLSDDVLILSRPDRNGLWHFSLSDNSFKPLLEDYSGLLWAAWEVNGEYVYYLESGNDISKIKRVKVNEVVKDNGNVKEGIETFALLDNYSYLNWSRISVSVSGDIIVSNKRLNEEDITSANLNFVLTN